MAAMSATGKAAGATAEQGTSGEIAQKDLDKLLMDFACTPIHGCNGPWQSARLERDACVDAAVPATPRCPTMEHMTDPSYFQVEIGYKFGNTGVAVSWYQSSDFQREGSSGTAIGIGARHTFPKAGADIYAAVQNYAVKMTEGGESVDETVVAIGTKVTF